MTGIYDVSFLEEFPLTFRQQRGVKIQITYMRSGVNRDIVYFNVPNKLGGGGHITSFLIFEPLSMLLGFHDLHTPIYYPPTPHGILEYRVLVLYLDG